MGPTERKEMSAKKYGIRKELERQRYYQELWPEAFVYHIRGSLGGLFDLVVIGEREPCVTCYPHETVVERRTHLSVSLIDIKAGSERYIRLERGKFKKHCDRLPILTGLHYLFDSTVRGSGVWTSESYPADFEEE